MHRHMTPHRWALAFGDPDDRHGWQLYSCSSCSAARGDLEMWLQAVASCPRCWPAFQSYEPFPGDVLECETCMDAYQDLEDWLEKTEHFEPLVAAEWEASRQILEELTSQPAELRLMLVTSEPSYHRWGLCQRLLDRSRSLWLTDPRAAHEWGSTGAVVADHLTEDGYGPQWVADLRAKAHGYVANTLRLLGQYAASEREFAIAERWVDRGVGQGRAEATILSLKASLLLDQYRHLEAEALLDRVNRHFQDYEQRHEAGRALLQLALVSHARDLPAQAVQRTEEALRLIDPARDALLPVMARQNLVAFRVESGDLVGARAAFEELPELQDLLPRLRRTWLEADLLRAEGDLDGAARLYDDIRIAFLADELYYNVALVSLDLAIVATLQGRTDTVRELARDAVVLLARSGAPQEAFAALRLLVDSLEREAVSVTFIRRIARKLTRLQPSH